MASNRDDRTYDGSHHTLPTVETFKKQPVSHLLGSAKNIVRQRTDDMRAVKVFCKSLVRGSNPIMVWFISIHQLTTLA